MGGFEAMHRLCCGFLDGKSVQGLANRSMRNKIYTLGRFQFHGLLRIILFAGGGGLGLGGIWMYVVRKRWVFLSS